MMDNRDIEEQLETLRRSRASSPTYSSISSTAKSGSNGGGGGGSKPFVIIAGGGETGELYDDSTRLQLAKATNFAELSRLRETLGSNSAINIVYMQQDRAESGKLCLTCVLLSGFNLTFGFNFEGKGSGGASPPAIHHRRTSEHRKTTGGGLTIAEATSWEPQTPIVDSSPTGSGAGDLYSIRLKMEEKRKRIEAEKRQMELAASQQREKVGKAAFLQVRLLPLFILAIIMSHPLLCKHCLISLTIPSPSATLNENIPVTLPYGYVRYYDYALSAISATRSNTPMPNCTAFGSYCMVEAFTIEHLYGGPASRNEIVHHYP